MEWQLINPPTAVVPVVIPHWTPASRPLELVSTCGFLGAPWGSATCHVEACPRLISIPVACLPFFSPFYSSSTSVENPKRKCKAFFFFQTLRDSSSLNSAAAVWVSSYIWLIWGQSFILKVSAFCSSVASGCQSRSRTCLTLPLKEAWISGLTSDYVR